LNNARSVLAVRGLYASVAFFQEKLGLTIGTKGHPFYFPMTTKQLWQVG